MRVSGSVSFRHWKGGTGLKQNRLAYDLYSVRKICYVYDDGVV